MNRNVTAVILIVLSIGVYLEFTQNVWNDTQSIIAVNGTYQNAITDAKKVNDKVAQIAASYNSISASDQDRMNKILPTNVDNIRLIIDLNSVALRRGFTLHDITVTSPANTAAQPAPAPVSSAAVASAAAGTSILSVPQAPLVSVDTVTVGFNASATYQQFIQFMRDAEADLHILDVSHLSVKSHDNGIDDYTVEFKTYWLRQQ